ncbi:MAG: 5'-3' exonuclease H3TH domain-containing protein, partial [Candidatus Omnitrophota bacterium]|nr:5'-3' exonuclease H3TH domain-containing protein [Candidatus Omnitrophota bacterium]
MKNMKKKRLFLIDGNSFCYRAYYAIKELKNSKGQPTNAVYGFVLMLRKLLKSKKPDYIAVTFDLKGPTFRHKKFEDYKITRKPMPDDLVIQMPLIKETVSSYNIPIFEKQGFEADDVIATIAKKVSKQGIEVFIVTGDKDLLQLVDKNIKAYNMHKDGVIYDIKAVKERFSGLGPESIIDLMALAGDSTDNIPGVRGIGEKTAIELIKEFKTIENLYKNLDKIKSDAKRSILREGKENATISRELAALDTSVPIEIGLDALELKEPNSERLLHIFKELEFKNFAKELASENSKVSQEANYHLITDKKGFDGLINDLKKQKEFVLDFETTSKAPLNATLIGISFCWQTPEAYYVALGAGSKNKGSGITIEYALSLLKNILEDENIKKVGQNIKYEKLVLVKYNVALKGASFDTMVASYILNPSKLNHNLDDLAFEYLQHKKISLDGLLGTGKKRITMDEVPLEK